MLVNFKAVRFAFAPNGAGDATILRTEPPLAEVAVSPPPPPAAGPCNDWRASIGAAFTDRGDAASATFAGRFPASCGERDWHVALLDHPHYVRGMFATYFGEAGGRFTGGVREGRPPAGAAPFATMASAPLYDIVRDINKLSNNVMARQVFLTLATTAAPPPATPAGAADAMRRWLDRRKIDRRGFVVENGSGLSRNERSTAAGLAQLLAAADASPVREEFASSLAVAAVDGTLARRFTDRPVAGQALLKTGSLEGVRALAGYVIDAESRRWIVVAIINHANARARAAGARRAGPVGLPRRGGVVADARPADGAAAAASSLHAGNRPAVLEQQIAADHPVEHPDRSDRPDRQRERNAQQRDEQHQSRPRSTGCDHQNVRISQRRCDGDPGAGRVVALHVGDDHRRRCRRCPSAATAPRPRTTASWAIAPSANST